MWGVLHCSGNKSVQETSSPDTDLFEDHSLSLSNQRPASSNADSDVPEAGKAMKGTQQLIKAGLWSVGSKRHGEGLCKPCHFVHTTISCKSGQDCAFCHLPHSPAKDKPKKNRPGKGARERCQKWLAVVHQASEDPEVEQLKQMVLDVTRQSTYMQSIAHKQVQQQPHETAVPHTFLAVKD